MPSHLPLVCGLKRKAECNTCQACAMGCGSQAIDRRRAASTSASACCAWTAWSCTTTPTPARRSSKERKRREKAGLPLTPIGGRRLLHSRQAGSRIERRETRMAGAKRTRSASCPGYVGGTKAHRRSGCAASCGTTSGPGAGTVSAAGRFAAVVRHGLGARRASRGLAARGDAGRIGPAATLAWWIGWSVYEVLMRLHRKPWRQGRAVVGARLPQRHAART